MNALKKYSTLFILLIYGTGFSQNNIQSERELTYESLKDSIKKYSKTDVEKSIYYANSYIDIAKKDKDIAEEYKGLYYVFQVYKNNKESFLKETKEQIKLLEDFTRANNLKKDLANIYIQKAYLEYDINEQENIIRTDKRLEYFIFARKIAKEADEYSLELSAHIQLLMEKKAGENYLKILEELEDLALEVQNRGYDKKFTAEEKMMKLGWIYHTIIDNYLLIENAEKAVYYNQRLYENYFKNRDSTFKKINSVVRFMHFYNKNKGEIHFLKKEYDSAEVYYKRAVKVQIPNHSISNDSIRLLGKVACLKKEYEKSLNYFKPFEQYADSISEYEQMYIDDVYKYIGLSYKGINNYKKANFYLEKYINSISLNNTYKDSINLSLNRLEIALIENEIEDVKRLKKRGERYVFLLTVFFVLVVIGFVFFTKNRKKKYKEKFDALIDKIHKEETTLSKTSKLKSKISNIEVERIIIGLNQLEQTKYYLSIDCSLSSIAKEINTNTSYLSKIVNTHYEKSFNAYINELRINYVVQRLKTDRFFRKYSIQSIANEIGFKSKESFNKAFRNQTGILPSFYIKQLELIV